MVRRIRFAWLVLLSGTLPLYGQWNPADGQWLKSDITDLRVMTWNVRDGLCSSNDKIEGRNNWCALARVVAAMQPDILILQETGDNAGNGTGGGVDSASTLAATLELFLHGGLDPFHANAPITSWVQKYAPSYDLPHVFVSSITDGFNRNVILSRFPFTDLNGDTKERISDIPSVIAPAGYAAGGNGGIRGFQFAEIDLPDADYSGNLVIGNAHLKSGGNASDLAERLAASKNVAYVIDHWFNGAGASVPDPNGRISDSPPAQFILDPSTPVVIGGDWNEDELNNGRKGPAEWLTHAEFTGGTDGTDKDRSDMTYDAAVNPFNGSRNTLGSGKLDYLAWQDSVAVLRTGHAFVFNTAGLPLAWFPPEVEGYPGLGGPGSASGDASDHRPVIIDLILPAAPPACVADEECDDGILCTLDTCILESCTHAADDELCDNGDFCDGEEICVIDVGCQPGSVPCPGQQCDESSDACVDCLIDVHCDDGDLCTDDVCVMNLCNSLYNNSPCDDGDYCTEMDTCADGVCAGIPETRMYADVFPIIEGDGVVDVDDISCVLNGFADAGDCPTADIAPCAADSVVDVDDISAVLDAFAGIPLCMCE